jgi:transcriptional regulator with XRE-family HTH domain
VDVEGKELKERRQALGWTQAQLADRLGVKPNTVARWENGVLEVPVWLPLALATLEREHGTPPVRGKASKPKE